MREQVFFDTGQNTASYSRPFAVCSVMSDTVPDESSSSSAAATSDTR